MKKISCQEDWDNARKVFPEDKNLWPLTDAVVGKKLKVSMTFIQRLRAQHNIPKSTIRTVPTKPIRIATKKNRTWAPKGCEDLMILMRDWKRMVRQ